MALINKFFSSRKKSYIKHQDVSERTFTFTKDQVRLVLFRECDFRGRKLLFDSQSVQKIPVNSCQNNCNSKTTNKTEIYFEITNGYRYQYSRPSSDIIQLGEIVFGTVAMSFRGTSLKIHSFNSPAKLMCTQIFPSPRHQLRGRVSVASQQYDDLVVTSRNSFEKSSKFDNSSTSSTQSFNEQLSLQSTSESELKLRSPNGSIPLDVPIMVANTNDKLAPRVPSLEGDSGFCGEQSYSSGVSSGPPSMSLWDSHPTSTTSSVHGFSCGSLYKRWLRSASTSLEYNNTCSDNSLSTGIHSTQSADECITRSSHRSSKLGLAVIIRLSEGQEIDLERFLLEHSALMEAMVCRARAGAESAYIKPNNFASLMYQVYKETSQWLVALTTGPTLHCYLWHHLLGSRNININKTIKPNFICDNITKTKSESSLLMQQQQQKQKCDRTKDVLFTSSLLDINRGRQRKFFDASLRRSILKPLTNYSNCNISSSNESNINNAELFVQQLCELLETIDTKHTNFFVSTLITAVLTHHLGWVSTVLPPSQNDKDTLGKLPSPCNPLWGQLSDLYGAVGSPTKCARTIICGNANNSCNAEIISKILYTLTYFIRCSIVERNTLNRYSTQEENKEADAISHFPTLSRSKTCLTQLQQSQSDLKENETNNKPNNVVFVLGDDDELINLNTTKKLTHDLLNIPSCSNMINPSTTTNKTNKSERPTNLNIPFNNCGDSSDDTSPELSSSSEKVVITRSSIINLETGECQYNRSQSVPPSDKKKCSKNGCKKKYSGVKFDFKQYPQIYKNYMKNKNLPFAEKDLKMTRSFSVSLYDCSSTHDLPSCDCVETLQTPSNATELTEKNAIFEHDTINTAYETTIKGNQMNFMELPMPRVITKTMSSDYYNVGYTKTLLRGVSDKYISDMVLQGTLSSPKNWDHILRRDLQLAARKPLLDQPVQEAVGIIANIDTWEVQLISSQKFIVEKGCENRVGMSQLIANMLETLLHMWKLRIPPEYCLMHIESRLREFCIRSKALAQLLLNTEFCNMNFLTSTLQLEVNDVPLLMAVASTHSPQVTQKYGLSFQ